MPTKELDAPAPEPTLADPAETAQGVTSFPALPKAGAAEGEAGEKPPDLTADAGTTLLAEYRNIMGRLNQLYGPQIAEGEAGIQAAQQRAERTAQTAVKPAIEAVRQQAAIPSPPVPAAIPEPPVPNIQPRPFLSGMRQPLDGIIGALGLLTQLGMAGTAPVTALNAMAGAMNGWAKGDRERAEAQWTEYLGTADRIRHENAQALKTWEASMRASDGNMLKAQALYAAGLADLDLADRGVAVEKEGMARTLGMLDRERKVITDMFGKTLDVMKWQATSRLAEEQAKATQEQRHANYLFKLEAQRRQAREDVARAQERIARAEERARTADRLDKWRASIKEHWQETRAVSKTALAAAQSEIASTQKLKDVANVRKSVELLSTEGVIPKGQTAADKAIAAATFQSKIGREDISDALDVVKRYGLPLIVTREISNGLTPGTLRIKSVIENEIGTPQNISKMFWDRFLTEAAGLIRQQRDHSRAIAKAMGAIQVPKDPLESFIGVLGGSIGEPEDKED